MIDSRKSGDNGIKAFWTNIDFRMRFTDLVYKHFCNDGAMTDENVIAAFDSLNNYIYRPIICESARWGDERSTNPMDRDMEWDAARLAVRKDLEGRADNFISKLRNTGYYSKVPAPKYMSGGAEIASGIWETTANSLTISGAGAYGTLYYTTDGTDPRTWDLTGSVSANAISEGGSTIAGVSIVKARIKQSNNWSPLHEIEVISENSVIIEVIKAEIAVSSGSFGNEHSKALHLYPNPVSDKLYFSQEKSFTVYSSKGIFITNGKGSEISMGDLPVGLYFISVDNVAYKVLKVD